MRRRPDQPRASSLSRTLVVALALVIAACSQGATTTFDPAAPCTADAKLPGAYPALEALIPRTFDGRPPDRLDSGRNCTSRSLGLLATAGYHEVHFAGGLWEVGQRSGVTLAVFTAEGLTAAQLADFYEAGARAASKTENVTRSTVDVEGAQAIQIETLNDESFQTIVVWPGSERDTVRAVLVASDVRESKGIADHRERLAAAEAAFAAS